MILDHTGKEIRDNAGNELCAIVGSGGSCCFTITRAELNRAALIYLSVSGEFRAKREAIRANVRLYCDDMSLARADVLACRFLLAEWTDDPAWPLRDFSLSII
jgi:hypothetical protein